MNNSAIRAKALDLVRRYWGTMICMLLLMVAAYIGATLVLGLVTGLLTSLLGSVGGIVSLLGFLVIGVAASGLTLGYYAGMMSMHDGKTVRATDIFGSLSASLPAFGLGLWIGLWVFLWMLPGLAVIMLGALIGSEGLMVVLMIVGYVLMLVCVIRAAFSYAMAMYALADQPHMGVFAAMNKSKSMMNGRRWQLFCLTIPYALISIVVSLAVSLVISLGAALSADLAAVLSIVGMVVMVVASVVVALLSNTACVCFYKALNPTGPAADPDGFGTDQPTVNVNFDF